MIRNVVDHRIRIIRKTADEIVNNSTALQDDDELFLSAGINEVWEIKCWLRYNSTAVADLKTKWEAPAGAEFYYTRFTVESLAVTGTTVTYTGSLGNPALSKNQGILIMGATPGVLQLTWAQNNLEATDSKMLKDSCIIATRLA